MPQMPTWFGPSERPLFGWVHLPADGQARAAVVLCPPLGLEALNSYDTFRQLATRLEVQGFAVLRFAYDGTGDSAGDRDDPDRIEAWRSSIREAIAFVRKGGADRVSLLGMRVGAILAALEADHDGDINSLVLWDPCTTGRAFLSEQRAIQLISLGSTQRKDGAVETPGFVYSAEVANDLKSLDLTAAKGALARMVLVLTRPTVTRDRRLAQRLSMPHVVWDNALGQPELLDVAQPGKPPEKTLDRVVSWLSDTTRSDRSPMSLSTRAHTVVGWNDHGEPIQERALNLGPLGLFGILTERPGNQQGPTVIFLNTVTTCHVGLSRLWVELGRHLALRGLRCLRVDLSGIGDSPVRQGQPARVMRAPEAMEDVPEIARSISPEDPSNVVLVGLCSGAYQAIESGLDLAPRGVVAINPLLTFKPPELASGKVDPRRKACCLFKPWVRKLLRGGTPTGLAGKFPRLPDPVWRAINTFLINSPPIEVLAALTSLGVDTLIVCGTYEAQAIWRGAPDGIRALSKGRLHLEVLPEVDHAVLIADQREKVVEIVTSHLFSTYVPSSDEQQSAIDSKEAAGKERALAADNLMTRPVPVVDRDQSVDGN